MQNKYLCQTVQIKRLMILGRTFSLFFVWRCEINKNDNKTKKDVRTRMRRARKQWGSLNQSWEGGGLRNWS